MDSKIIGYRINAALASENKKQKELAKELGVTDNTISYFCSGKRTPNISQIVKIAKYLNVSADYLLGIEDGTTHDTTELMDALGLSESVIAFFQKNKNSIYNKCIETLIEDHQREKTDDQLSSSLFETLSAFCYEASKDEDVEFSIENGKLKLKVWGNNDSETLISEKPTILSEKIITPNMSFVYQQLFYYKELINAQLTQYIQNSQQSRIQKHIEVSELCQ